MGGDRLRYVNVVIRIVRIKSATFLFRFLCRLSCGMLFLVGYSKIAKKGSRCWNVHLVEEVRTVDMIVFEM